MNPFVHMCVTAIKSGRMIIDQVPPRYRAEVEAVLAAQDDS